jgi:hypothetical protein
VGERKHRNGRGGDDLISKLVEDAEHKGLEATGDWMKITLVEQRSFEVPEHDAEADNADAEHDRKLNSKAPACLFGCVCPEMRLCVRVAY